MEEIMWTWPARRFEKAFGRHLLRVARERARDLRDRMIVAFSVAEFSKDEDRQKAIEGIQERYYQTVESLYGDRDEGEKVDEVREAMAADPLFRSVMNTGHIHMPNEGAGQAILARQ